MNSWLEGFRFLKCVVSHFVVIGCFQYEFVRVAWSIEYILKPINQNIIYIHNHDSKSKVENAELVYWDAIHINLYKVHFCLHK